MNVSGVGGADGAPGSGGRWRLEDLVRQADREAAEREQRAVPLAVGPPFDAPSPARANESDPLARGRQAFAAQLGEFRRTQVLVPLHEGGLLSALHGGVRWIYAFSDEETLAHFAAGWELRPADGVEYRAMYGARLLDVVIPAAGEPTGVALDVADADAGGCVLFPPVSGIVPESAAVDESTGETTA